MYGTVLLLRFLCLLFLVLDIGALVWASGVKRRLQGYEFEHRSAGGIVIFPDVDASRRHSFQKRMAEGIHFLAVIAWLPGFFLLLAGLFV